MNRFPDHSRVVFIGDSITAVTTETENESIYDLISFEKQ